LWTVEEGLRAGAGNDVPLLVGATREECGAIAHANRHLLADRAVVELLDELGLEADAARRFAAALPADHPADVVGQYVSDVMFRRRIVDWLELRRDDAPTWAYDFAWRSGISGVAEHCLDVPFIFDLFDDPDVNRVAGPQPPQSLADRVHACFMRFTQEGNPGWPS